MSRYSRMSDNRNNGEFFVAISLLTAAVINVVTIFEPDKGFTFLSVLLILLAGGILIGLRRIE